jgi:hypothetical protein
MTILRGACYCGQIEVSLETAMAVDAMTIRACSCSFCRRHGTKAVADPNGRLTIVAPQGGLHRYRFGLRTADYLICRTCGVYLAVVIGGKGQARGTLNVTGTAVSAFRDRPAEPVNYDHEDAAQRRTRRLTTWTPTEIVERRAQAEVG